jgi:hypothetical protein
MVQRSSLQPLAEGEMAHYSPPPQPLPPNSLGVRIH